MWMLGGFAARAQVEEGKKPAEARESGAAGEEKAGEEKELPEPKTDITLLAGSDFVRPGGYPRANLSLGVGHDFEAVKKDPWAAA